jgi:N6-adenosine-specific RNA methylase IME4
MAHSTQSQGEGGGMTVRSALVGVGSKLGLAGKVTRVSWAVPKACTFSEWLKAGEMLAQIEGAVLWWMGDWWNAYKPEWGERAALFEREHWHGPAYETCRQAGWVCSVFQFDTRVSNLSFRHHVEVAGIADESQRLALLQWAEREGASTRALRAEIAKQRQQHTLADMSLPSGRYPLLLTDPPWRYENPPMGGGNRSIENHYPTMPLEDICAFPVAQIAADDALLYMWATSPKLAECFAVIEAWGFTYRTNIVWVKDKIGMGYHARSQHELLLIAKRGELPPPLPENRESSVVYAERGRHSEKPEAFYQLIERWYPTLPKVELFAREPRDGWISWGNQLAVAAQ